MRLFCGGWWCVLLSLVGSFAYLKGEGGGSGSGRIGSESWTVETYKLKVWKRENDKECL